MKKLIYIVIFMMSTLFSGCNEDCDAIWDFVPSDICIFVKNAAGENLMDSGVEGNWLDRDIYVEYNGQTYRMNVDDTETRAIMPYWQGLRTASNYNGTEPIMLKFGEFSPDSGKHKGDIFTIHWGDGTSDQVKFDLFVTWKKCDPTIHKALWFNGEEISGNSFIVEIVK